jgi:hypothetical protein
VDSKKGEKYVSKKVVGKNKNTHVRPEITASQALQLSKLLNKHA